MKRRYFLKGSFLAGFAVVFGIRTKAVDSITIFKGQTLGPTTLSWDNPQSNPTEDFSKFMDLFMDELCRVQKIPKELLTKEMSNSYSLSKETILNESKYFATHQSNLIWNQSTSQRLLNPTLPPVS